MNFFEFISDEYIAASFTWHLEGFFLNRIPLLRKLKWREVVSAKGVMGRYNTKNNQAMELLENSFTLEQKPFGEAGLGIENILKVLRVDGLWRLSYLDNPNIIKFAIRARLQLDF